MKTNGRHRLPGTATQRAPGEAHALAVRNQRSSVPGGGDITAPKTTVNAARDFLSQLFRDIWPGQEEIEVIRPDVTLDGMNSASSLAAAEDVVGWLRRLDQQPRDMQRAYFSVAPRQDTEDGLGQLVAVVCAHVHLHEAHPACFLAKRPNGVPPPSAVIASDSIVSALWFLDRPLREVADWPTVEWINGQLARAFRAPRAEATIEQQLELPRAYGSLSDRHGAVPVLVREGFRPDLRYDPEAFFADCEVSPRRKRSASRALPASDSRDQDGQHTGSRPRASRRKGKVTKR